MLIAGLAIQVATFFFFMAIMGKFYQLTRSGEIRGGIGEDWKKVLISVSISSALIMVSSSPTSQEEMLMN